MVLTKFLVQLCHNILQAGFIFFPECFVDGNIEQANGIVVFKLLFVIESCGNGKIALQAFWKIIVRLNSLNNFVGFNVTFHLGVSTYQPNLCLICRFFVGVFTHHIREIIDGSKKIVLIEIGFPH